MGHKQGTLLIFETIRRASQVVAPSRLATATVLTTVNGASSASRVKVFLPSVLTLCLLS